MTDSALITRLYEEELTFCSAIYCSSAWPCAFLELEPSLAAFNQPTDAEMSRILLRLYHLDDFFVPKVGDYLM